MAAKILMLQGTASHVGKTTLAAGLCRLYRRRGWKVGPFKAQNMSSLTYCLPDGRPIGVGQAVQAFAAGLAPDSRMNPVCLCPGEQGMTMYLHGRRLPPDEAEGFYRNPQRLMREVLGDFAAYAAEKDLLLIEGAGSPAELNLMGRDIANTLLARALGAPVVLVGDVERGGVFASLYGTVRLLSPEDRARITGLIINKFHGDTRHINPGPRLLEERLEQEEGRRIPVLGTVPALPLHLPEEDTAVNPFVGWDSPKRKELDSGLDRLADALEGSLDLETLERQMRTMPDSLW